MHKSVSKSDTIGNYLYLFWAVGLLVYQERLIAWNFCRILHRSHDEEIQELPCAGIRPACQAHSVYSVSNAVKSCLIDEGDKARMLAF